MKGDRKPIQGSNASGKGAALPGGTSRVKIAAVLDLHCGAAELLLQVWRGKTLDAVRL